MDLEPDISSEEAPPADPYGDVALGVECAWPESLPLGLAPAPDPGQAS